MQILYSLKDKDDDINKHQRFLKKSMEDMYDLHLGMVALFAELHKKAETHIDKSQNKYLATDEDINPSLNFVNNRILKTIRESEELSQLLEKRKLNPWYLDFEYVDIIFKSILKSDIYKDYLKLDDATFKEDKFFLIDLYTNVIASNDQLYEFLEDKKLTWIDDFPVINTNILKLLRKFKPNSEAGHFLPNLIKDEDDREFAKDLMSKVILNEDTYNSEIDAKTKNWDSERIARIDMVLLKMSLCEFQAFLSIPYKVTINEYLEISKEYSTPKSSIFINGILDKIVRDYKSKGIHQKVGRGLL